MGAASSAALAANGAMIGCLGPGLPIDPRQAAERPEVLSHAELQVLSAVAERVIAPAPAGPTALDTRVARRIDRELAIVGGRLAEDVPAALTLIEYGPWLDLRFGRFTTLDAKAQDDSLRTCEHSRFLLRRQAYAGLRLLCLFMHYSDDRTWPSIGYAGPMVPRKLPEAANAIEALDRSLGAGIT